MTKAPKFRDFITEAVQRSDIHVVVLTKVNADSKSVVSNLISDECEKRKIPCHIVDTREAWVSKNDLEKGTLLVSNLDGKDTEVEFELSKTICFVRAGVLEDETGLALLSTFENAGAFMINTRDGMLTCDNKMSAYISFERDNIPTPRTALISNEKGLLHAHERLGGKYPVIMKTLTGTQGIGVSIVESEKSMVSVAQSLWKFGAALLLQEYLKFDFDIRTIVVNGKILASTKRTSAKKDFRSNRHREATTQPYKLSNDERKLVLDAARSVGAYMVGVDHAIVNGEHFILECNGSAGLGSEFGLYNTFRDDESYVGEAKPKKIMKELFDYITQDVHRKHSFNKESGFHERVVIDGYGPIRAKFDTGNGTHASMFVVDKIDVSGKTVKWEKDGKKFTSKLQGESHPTHNTKIDERPIVFVNLTFNNKYYVDVPVGLTTKDSKSTFLVNRDLITRFKVNVNPNRKFVLSKWIERSDGNDTEGININPFKA
jgi:RimK family alpha-L-glutamate ligase